MSGCPRADVLAGFDETHGAERTAVLEHVRACGRCREAFLGGDPSRLFALLALQAIPGDVLLAVSSGISQETSGPVSTAASARTGRARSSAWAAAVLLAVTLGTFVFRPVSEPTRSELASIGGGADRRPAAGVELLSSPGAARVVDLTVGETQVVMIFDERLGL